MRWLLDVVYFFEQTYSGGVESRLGVELCEARSFFPFLASQNEDFTPQSSFLSFLVGKYLGCCEIVTSILIRIK